MKTVSENFLTKIKAPVKQIDTVALVAWEQEIDPDKRFFTIGVSALGGDDPLWNGKSNIFSLIEHYKFTDESARLKSWSLSRKTSQRPWGLISSSLTLEFNNASGRYYLSEDFPYTNRPNRPVRLQVSIDGEAINLFSGYSTKSEITVTNSTYKIRAYDFISYLSTCNSSLSAIIQQPIDYIIRQLLLEAGLSDDKIDLEPGVQPCIDYVAPNGLNTASLLQDLCEAEQYLLFADGDGVVHGWNANHWEVVENSESWQVDFDNATGMSFGATSIINAVRVEATPYKVVPSSKFFSLASVTDDCLVPANGTTKIFLDLQDDDGNAVYAIDFDKPTYGSTNNSSYTTNLNEDGSGGTNKDAISLTQCVNFGNSVLLQFSNSSAYPTYITGISLVGSSAQIQRAVSIDVVDEDSVALYGVNPSDTEGNTLVFESKYAQNEEFATQVAERIVSLYANAPAKIEASTFFTPQLEIGDQILASVGQAGEFNTLLFGYEMSGNSEGNYTQKLYLEERAISNYFILDESLLDEGDAYAM